MQRAIIALMLLVGSVWSAHAGPSIGAGQIRIDAPIINVACNGDDRACSQGLYYACGNRGCQCYICGTGTAFNDYYYSQRRYSPAPQYYAPPPPPPRPRYYQRPQPYYYGY